MGNYELGIIGEVWGGPNQFAAMSGSLIISGRRGDLDFLERTLWREDLFFFFWRTRPIIVCVIAFLEEQEGITTMILVKDAEYPKYLR